ncbi:UDP-glucose--tetrahydrobiopterin glucosyltransferase [Phormidesmis priestleyi ULC007]|uniref:UDP-glucose--tetrahydrobiopterin glucosyltransferase n=1 Tax=Phormidesmis priestleyi ULC007 TaxID=1920490 RepID=A0A2T1DDF4_9CYAN|nr:glycosyltransferase family 4 protein [Phormidesmis priestleyi]PSB18552.1 UDP-glucose--tetrahydrobiopterin glucosyltransferase [Phormidesmis priestleyi ULC007]PZO49799.1 MAG: UDP-glucose--tetrahydrobiopterin glucosyltransferase [Phormidesmis priestleyi]
MTRFQHPLKLLLLSTSVGALGSGLGGGVELTLKNIAQALKHQGHQVTIVAPAHSVLEGVPLVTIAGNLQITAQTQGGDALITLPPNAVLGNMWAHARQVQHEYNLLINFAYDWLPFYLTPFFERPIAHLVSMGSLTDAMDQIIEQIAVGFPGTIAVHSRAQAETFQFADRCRNLQNGFDLSLYEFCAQPKRQLAWVGRIAPEKGLEDAVAAAQIVGIPLKIWGVIQDRVYWNQICADYPDAAIAYGGFLPTSELQQVLGQSQALLMTPRWVEAFGNVAIEALACGVPVIAYRRGGPAEIVRDGETGWLVEPDSVDGLVNAIAQLDRLDRQACRRQAEAEYSLEAMSDRLEAWFETILKKV